MSPTSTLDLPPLNASRQTGAKPTSTADALVELANSFTLAAIKKQVDAGAQAVWTDAAWESPIILAADFIPVSYAELWLEDSKRTEAIAEGRFQMPPEFCSMIKCILGRLHTDREGKLRRILYYGAACEPVSIVFEMVKKEGYDVHCIDSVTAYKPEDITPEAVRFLAEGLRKGGTWLAGKPVDENRIKAEIIRKNRVLRKVRTLLELRIQAPFHIGNTPAVLSILGTGHFFGQPEKFEQILDQLIDELKLAAKKEQPRKSFVPLVLNGMGGPQLCSVIEKANGVILGWGAMDAIDYREDIPPLDSIALNLLQTQLRGGMGDIIGSPFTLRRIGIEEKVRATNAKGIISTAVIGCPFGSIVQQSEREYFKKQGVPIMTLEHTIHNEPLSEEQIMKVQTFIEMIS